MSVSSKKKASWVLNPAELFSFVDLESHPSSRHLILGVDEVGAGCLAGPLVVASAGIFVEDLLKPENFEVLSQLRIGDSKKMPAKARDEAFEIISSLPIVKSEILFISPTEIDALNIFRARMRGLGQAVLRLSENEKADKLKSYVFVDGPQKPEGLFAADWNKLECISKGDSKNFMIAMASVIAKVTRDRFMQKLSEDFPDYLWDRNVGYPTPEHKKIVSLKGPTLWHRKSFLGFLLAGDENQDVQKFEAQIS